MSKPYKVVRPHGAGNVWTGFCNKCLTIPLSWVDVWNLHAADRDCTLGNLFVLSCMKTSWKQQMLIYLEPDTSPVLVCSLLSFPAPPEVCPCFIVAICPSIPPSFAAWGTDSAADKAAAAAGRDKQYPGAHCSTAYATKHGWRQPKGQAPKDSSAGVCVLVWCVYHLYPLPLSISIQRILLVCIHGRFRESIIFWDQQLSPRWKQMSRDKNELS